jgi:putative flippase GtrA
LGTLVSFFFNRKITFDAQDKVAQRLTIFLGIAVIGFSISALMLWLMVDVMMLNPKIAKLLTLPVVVIFQFSLNRRITFEVLNNK